MPHRHRDATCHETYEANPEDEHHDPIDEVTPVIHRVTHKQEFGASQITITMIVIDRVLQTVILMHPRRHHLYRAFLILELLSVDRAIKLIASYEVGLGRDLAIFNHLGTVEVHFAVFVTDAEADLRVEVLKEATEYPGSQHHGAL